MLRQQISGRKQMLKKLVMLYYVFQKDGRGVGHDADKNDTILLCH